MFGAKRKARKIQVAEDDEEPSTASASAADEPMQDAPPPSIGPSSIKFTRRPAKSSSLRKSINVNGDEDTPSAATTQVGGGDDDDDDDARPAVIRPSLGRSGSTKLKKKSSSSRLSFGGDTAAPDAAAAALSSSTPSFSTPKKNPAAASLTQRATENSAIRASASSRALPTRSFGAERERPTYSREYLEELQSSTPNAPASLGRSSIGGGGGDDAMALDDAELEGAVFVPAADLPVSMTGAAGAGRHIPSTAEVREKKERRARLAREGDAYRSDPDDDDEDGYISLGRKKKEDETRLIAEDEDLGEGYDEFVEDGRLELGRRGETAARRRQRAEMAELIDTAEGAASGEEQDSDSDAERKAAYEEAQTRAAMAGLRAVGAAQQDDGDDGVLGVGRLVIPRMRPLPELGASLARMKELVAEMDAQVAAKRKRIDAVEKEKREILDREREVQDVLNKAGLKYQSAMGFQSETIIDPEKLAAQSPLRGATQLGSGERGLESFGTPTRRPEEDQMEE